MERRFAPTFSFLLLCISLTNAIPAHTGGRELYYKLLASAENNYQQIKRSLNDGDKEDIKSGEPNGGLLKLFSRELPVKIKRNVQTMEHDTIASAPGELYPETEEQMYDKVGSHTDKKSEIPTQETRNDKTFTQETREDNKAIYNIGQDAALEIPLTTQVHERNTRVEELAKRDTVSQNQGSTVLSENKIRSQDTNVDRQKKKSGTMKDTSRRRDEVPGANILPSSLDDPADENFQVRDKSADLEIHADSSGVRVKAKPASLQVVSNPHGNVKTLAGETHAEGMVAERRTFTPVFPSEKHTHHHHHLLPGLEPRTFQLRHYHRLHRHHRLPWLRHRQHINYPDVFERMRFQNPMPEAPSPFSVSSGMGLPLTQPMASMINPPLPIMSNSGMMGGERMGGGTGGPLIPQFLQRSPIMEGNAFNRFGVPENPMGELPSMAARRFSPIEEMNPIGRMNFMGGMLPREMSPVGEMSSMGGMPTMAGMSPMDNMGQMGQMEQMDPMMSSMPGMSPSSFFNQGPLRRKNALEFWGMPNQDQLKALARGENVQKVLGSNKYGESLGGITGEGMGTNIPASMGGPSFNANGMEDIGMMGPYGGTRSAMFRGIRGPMSMMDSGMRQSLLYKKDDINKTDEYKKAIKTKKSRDALRDTKENVGKKFEKGIMEKAESLVAGQKHIAKNEETTLHREHRIRKSSKLSHDEEKRSLPQEKDVKKNSVKHEKTKNVKGSKKDVAVQRPPIIYHPPPEVYHRPDIVMHRAPVLFQRPPIIYHQAPVVIHRPAVVYRQPPIVFHQPSPVVNQPYYRAADIFMMHPAYSHVGSHVAQTYNYMGVPSEVMGYKKEAVPSKPTTKENVHTKSKRGEISHEKSKRNKNEKVAQKKKKDVVVNRPPIIYHPPPEVYHRPQIVVHRAPLLIRRPPIVYHQPAVIVHRPPVVYHQPPIVFHQPAPTVNQPVLYSHDNFVVHPSFFSTHHGSIVSDAGRLLGIPNTISAPNPGVPYEPVGANPEYSPAGIPGEMGQFSPAGAMLPPFIGRRKRSLRKNKVKRITVKRKNAVLLKHPSVVYHQFPEFYHQPNIVVHRAPLVIHRSPVVHHQPPVVVHRTSVVYDEPHVVFDQPSPMVHQPTFTSYDMYNPHESLTLFSPSTSSTPLNSNIVSVPIRASKKNGIKSKKISKKSNMNRKKSAQKNSKELKKYGILEYIEKLFSENDAKILARFFSRDSLEKVSIPQLLSIIKDRKLAKDNITTIVHDAKIKDLTVEQLRVIEDFLNEGKISIIKLKKFLNDPKVLKTSIKKLRKKLDEYLEHLRLIKIEEGNGLKKEEILKPGDDKTEKKNVVLVKRPQIVYHPPPEVYHRPDIVVHRAPLVIHRAPIVYHQPPVIVHRPAVVYHQPPVLFHQPPPVVSQPVLTSHDVYYKTSTLTHSGSTLTQNGAYLGVPNGIVGLASSIAPQSNAVARHSILNQMVAFGKSKVPYKEHLHEKQHRSRRDVANKYEKASKTNLVLREDKTEKASKKNAVLVKRPPIIYHPPPEVYHRPDIVVHRAPIVIHRAPLVYHQPPVIVHRPAVVYHQPAVVFHQPPPMVHQPMFTAHDTFTPHSTLTVGGSSTSKVGDFEGPPLETLATRKGEVPTVGKQNNRNTVLAVESSMNEAGHSYKKSKTKGKNSHWHSHLHKLIPSLQSDRSERKSGGLEVSKSSQLVLPRPPFTHSGLAMLAPSLGQSIFMPSLGQPLLEKHSTIQRMSAPVVQSVVAPVSRHLPASVMYHHNKHLPMHVHHHHLQTLLVAPHAISVARLVPVQHQATYSDPLYNPYSYSKSEIPVQDRKDTIHVHDFGVPVHGHIGHVAGNSHVLNHHGYVVRHTDCPVYCGTCYPQCSFDCKPPCVTIIHHQHHQPHHVFVNHHHHHDIAQTHLHNHHWPVHHHDVYHSHPHHLYRHIGHQQGIYSFPYHLRMRRETAEKENDGAKKTMVPHYKVYQHVKHWHPPCIHHSQICHHHHHPMTVYHDHLHPTSVMHHHHYHPYPVYHHHEHIKPVVYHHIKPYPIHYHHNNHIHDTWHHDHYHVSPPKPYPVPVEVPVVVPTPVQIPTQMICSYPTPQCQLYPAFHSHGGNHIVKRSYTSRERTKKSETTKPEKETRKTKNKKKDVVVNRPPIIYHPPPEVYHRPEIVVHRAPVLVHRPPIVYHQPSVIVHRPPVVYHQPPVVFHQPSPTVNQPVLYSHDNFVVHPTMLARHAGTMVESAGHFLGLPSGPITNFPGSLPTYGGQQGFGMESYATPFQRKRRSTKEEQEKLSKHFQKEKSSSKTADRKNAIVVHRPPVIYHPPPEIYHRPRVVVHRPDVLIHRPPVVYHQAPVVLHRPPVIYHQTPIVFHQPPPMVNQAVYHSHDSYIPHPVFAQYDSDIHHVGAYQGIPQYGENYHGFHGGFFGGFSGFGHGFGRSKIEKPKQKKQHYRKTKTNKRLPTKKSEMTKKSNKREHTHHKHSVVVHRPPIIFHPAPEVYHRPAYVIHQPDVVIHRPPVVYHQSPVVVHHPAVAYYQHPIIIHQRPPLIVQPIYNHHQFYHCMSSEYGCRAGFGPGGFSGFGAFGRGVGGYGYGVFGHGMFGGFGGLYGKSGIPKHKHFKSHSKKPTMHSKQQTKLHNKAKKKHLEETKGSKKNEIVLHRPPLVYHPPPEIYHRPDIVVHRPDVLVHRPSVVYDQPAVVLHRPAVIYHEPPVVFHQPPPMVNLPIFHASDMYAPHSIYTDAGSVVGYDHNTEGIPPHFSYGPYGVSHAFGKSKIENHADSDNIEKKSAKLDKNFVKENFISKHNERQSASKHSEEPTIGEESEKSKRHSSSYVQTSNAHKKFHLVMHRPPIVYHSSPTVYHRPDVVVHQPDIVIHRPSVVVQQPSVVVHKPAVVYHQPSVVFHQPLPKTNVPIYQSHDAYAAHPVFLPLGTYLERGEQYIGHPAYGFRNDVYGDAHGFGFCGDLSDVVHHGFGVPGYPGNQDFAGFEKSKIQDSENVLENKHVKKNRNRHAELEHDKSKHNAKNEKHKDTKSKRNAEAKNTKRVQLPHAQKEKTETGTKKNAIMVRRPPIIYHPPPEVYHRPDIVVHRAPIVIQRAPLVYHQSPVIVHRPAVVYHQPAVVFHQPAPTVQQPVYHSLDSFQVHPHSWFSHAGSNVGQSGQYLGIPQEVMHRSKIERFHPPLVKNLHPKQRRSTLEQHITPITPFNFIRPQKPSFESSRSTIPYPTLNAFHPNALSYASFPWGHFSRIARSVKEYPRLDFVTQVPPKLLPPSYSPFYHHTLPTRPHVDVNIETVKSHIPRRKHRDRRQSTWDSSQVPAPAADPIHYIPTMSYPALKRPHANANIETVKSAARRSRRQVLAGLPARETQNLPAPAQAFAQTAVPVAPIQLPSTTDQSGMSVAPAQLPMAHLPDPTLGVYRDLLSAIYPRGARRRPKVNIVVQTTKSNIAKPVKKSVVPSFLRKENVDAFSTMPEVTTIEPPLLRDGVRVNMVDLGDPTAGSLNPETPRLPTYNDMSGNMQNLGPIVPGLGTQGNLGIDKLKKSSISQPSSKWHDVNAEKKSAVADPNQNAVARKRYSISGFQTSQQFSQYQPGSPADYSAEALSFLPLDQPSSADYTSGPFESHPEVSTASTQRFLPQSAPASYTPEPQLAPPIASGPENIESQPNLAQLGTASYDGQSRIVAQPERPHVNVNIDTIKKQTLGSSLLPSKRQLIGTLPLTSMFRPNPNIAKASLKSSVPSTTQSSKPVTKRQQIFRRVPLAQAIPPRRPRVASLRISPARPSSRPYSAFPAQNVQTLFHTPPAFSFQGIQTISPQKVLPASRPHVQQSLTQASQAMTPSPSSYERPTLFPWGGRRGHVNINIETTRSKIPTKSQKIITPRFKREFPVLYNIIKAKTRSEKSDWKKRRSRRQIAMFSGGFLQNLIPNANELAKRAFYGGVSRYPVSPAVLYTRARRLRPQSSDKAGVGTIEVGKSDAGSPLAGAASLLKNEFSQSFDDIAKIQREEVNDIKGMSMGRQPSSATQVLSLPARETPGAQVVSGQPPTMISAPNEASAVPRPKQVQQRQPEVVPVSSQQQMASFAAVPQLLPAAEQALPAQFAYPEASPQAPIQTASQVPVEIAPGFVRGQPQPPMQDAQLISPAPEPVLQTSEPAVQAPEQAVSPSKNSFTEVPVGQGQLPGFFPQLLLPGMQFPFLSPAELPQVALPYNRPVFNSIPQSEDESDRPSVNIQVQTSKSKIPKLKIKKKSHSKKDKGLH